MNPAIKIRRLERRIQVFKILLHKIINNRDLDISWHDERRMKKEIEEDLTEYELKMSKTKKGIHKKSKNYIQTCSVCNCRVKTHTTGTLFSHGHNYSTSKDKKRCPGSFKPGIKKEEQEVSS